MKNARTYEKKIKKLLRRRRSHAAAVTEDDNDPVRILIESILEEDSTARQAQKAMAAIEEEFVDFNELRVAPPKEIAERIGRGHPGARDRGEMLSKVLNAIYERTCRVSLEHLADAPKRELRRYLNELGLSPYAAASVFMRAFGGHAVPVDQALVDCLEMDGYVHPGSDIGDVQGFLERIVPQKNDATAHAALRAYVAKASKALAKKRQAEAAEAAAAAEAERKAEAARARAEKKKAAEKAARKTTRKAVRKTARKAARKTAKKKAGKTRKTTRKKAKPAGRTRRKTASRTRSRTRRS
jgi:endonuclease III